MWGPLDILLYEWWPVRAEVRLYDRLGAMVVEVVNPEPRRGDSGYPLRIVTRVRLTLARGRTGPRREAAPASEARDKGRAEERCRVEVLFAQQPAGPTPAVKPPSDW